MMTAIERAYKNVTDKYAARINAATTIEEVDAIAAEAAKVAKQYAKDVIAGLKLDFAAEKKGLQAQLNDLNALIASFRAEPCADSRACIAVARSDKAGVKEELEGLVEFYRNEIFEMSEWAHYEGDLYEIVENRIEELMGAVAA